MRCPWAEDTILAATDIYVSNCATLQADLWVAELVVRRGYDDCDGDVLRNGVIIQMHVRYRFSGVCVSVRVFFGALNMSEGCLFVLYRRGRAKLTPRPGIISQPHL